MTLAAGTRLGPYEILSPIGAGGMGEVYRARDESLGRDVAIKVLPAEVASDSERLKRFDKEGKAYCYSFMRALSRLYVVDGLH